jgi:2-oxoacid:acceptor oxidoreductase gamma subunit (pyruvate/2-ketoisovalerate family)
MLRIRFHGRGGQGMKTASRILGSAAFHAGYVVQDAPVYGAERRGAPMMAFTRIAAEPIRERGVIACPDLVVVADETLLTEPAAQPLAGCDSGCTLLLNSPRDTRSLQQMATHGGRLLVADFTTVALFMTQTLASLSTALGIAVALYTTDHQPPLLSVIGGLWGKDISEAEFNAVFDDLQRAATGAPVGSPRLLYTQPELDHMRTLLHIAGKEGGEERPLRPRSGGKEVPA